MNHPHRIEYYQAFPSVIKPVYNPCDAPATIIEETENTDKDWWDDLEDEDENA
jgi:hypothetical protein